MVYQRSGAGNRHFCDLLAKIEGKGGERYRSPPLPKRASKTWQNIVICVVKTTQPIGELYFCKQTKLSLATVWT